LPAENPEIKQTFKMQPVDFKPIEENWNKYLLSDGSVIEAKLIITKVNRTEKTEPDGTPIYNVTFATIYRVYGPEAAKELKKV
jgi:hypothetical protein